MGYFRIFAAVPGFFLSALILMLLWNANIQKILPSAIDMNYGQSLLVTITAWLVVAPLAAVGKKWW
ncbi:MAG: hypothetical protein PHE50_07850 [Dehalococcoidales bacterium]|nr:hypothetical protein [Dehalococcoidales bacterium]